MQCDLISGDPQDPGCDAINARIDNLVDDYNQKIIHRIDSDYLRRTRWSDRLADKIAAFGGSWRFIIIFSTFLALWLIWNLIGFTTHFDGPPFILLNLILSFIAAFQAPIIMMSQNRHAEQDKHEAVIDFAINYKAEQEVDDIQDHLHRLEDDVREIKEMLAKMKTEGK
ncbi:MAG TPA: DUF1003 domain-containing protein [Spirochaetia bacterium]|nr:DUF1003 domain-containing protein [Spirochaetia bacterium]